MAEPLDDDAVQVLREAPARAPLSSRAADGRLAAMFPARRGRAATVYPPRNVAEPAEAGVLDHGRHTSLIVAVPDGMIRYSYGDWNWYALRQTGPIEGTSALLWPTQAGLGRRQLPGPFSPEAVSEQVRVVIEDAIYLEVEAAAVRRMVAHLDRIYEENRAAAVYNEP